MNTPNFEHGKVYFKQFDAERVKNRIVSTIINNDYSRIFPNVYLTRPDAILKVNYKRENM